MNPARRGKIARLPQALRDELNNRMLEGQRGNKLVAWLNALPEVHAMLAEEFVGRPILPQNLTEWRQGGFPDWLRDREVRNAADRLGQTALAGKGKEELPDNQEPVTDILAYWVAARYAVDTGRVDASEGEARWRLLRAMCHDIVALRRGDHRRQEIDLRRDREELGPSRGWKGRARISFTNVIKKFLGNSGKEKPPENPAPSPQTSVTEEKSNLIKPDQTKNCGELSSAPDAPPLGGPPASHVCHLRREKIAYLSPE